MDESQFARLEDVVTPFLCIAVICGVVLIWLLIRQYRLNSRTTNIFGLCVFVMTIGILIFDIFALQGLYDNSWDAPSIVWLDIARIAFGITAYVASSIMSYNIYHVIVYKTQITFNWDTNRVFVILSSLGFLFLLTAFLIVGSFEYYGFTPILVKYQVTNLLSVSVKIAFALFNFAMYLKSEYYISTMSGALSAGQESIYFAAVKIIVKRMQLYPLCQLFCEIFYFIWLPTCGYSKVSSGDDTRMETKCYDFFIFSIVMVYLNAPFLLIIYLMYNPSLWKKDNSKQHSSNKHFSNKPTHINEDEVGPFSAYCSSSISEELLSSNNHSNSNPNSRKNSSNRASGTSSFISLDIDVRIGSKDAELAHNTSFNGTTAGSMELFTDEEILSILAESRSDHFTIK